MFGIVLNTPLLVQFYLCVLWKILITTKNHKIIIITDISATFETGSNLSIKIFI